MKMVNTQLELRKCFCYCCTCCWRKRNTVETKNRDVEILLLGLENVGTTEIGYILSGKKRDLHETTNGVQFFEAILPKCSLSITEIGGSKNIQKIWHQYYSRTMGLIFCYDMSMDFQMLQSTFDLLQKIASHQFMRGKVFLLIGTNSDFVNDAVQLYDIENRFALENIANQYCVNIRTIHFNLNELDNLWNGMEWLANSIVVNYAYLKHRIENDSKIDKSLKKQQSNKRKKFFNIAHRRPKTAPAGTTSSNHVGFPSFLSNNNQKVEKSDEI